jgi:hypothetical protein
MDPQKLRELVESELHRLGLDKSKVKIAFHTTVEFKDAASKESVDAPGGQALGFLDSLSQGDVDDYDDFAEQLQAFLGFEEEDDEDDEDEPDSDSEDDDEDDDGEKD